MRVCVCVCLNIVFKHRQLLLNRPIRTFKSCSTLVMVKANVWTSRRWYICHSVTASLHTNATHAMVHLCSSDSGGICEISENLICFFAWS